jgi:CRISPR-associated protein Csx3
MAEHAILREGKPQPSIRSKVIAFLGPPHSGKSVLLNAIRIQIQNQLPADWVNHNFFVLRACPDGEGDWFSEGHLDVVRTLRYKNQFDDQFVEQICEELEQLRQQKRLLLVDCGGKLDKKNQRILSLCTHALIVSWDPEQIPEWRGAARLSELEILAEVESVLSDCAEVQSESPLRIRLGQLKRGNESRLQIPEALIRAVTEGLDYETLHHGMESEESG